MSHKRKIVDEDPFEQLGEKLSKGITECLRVALLQMQRPALPAPPSTKVPNFTSKKHKIEEDESSNDWTSDYEEEEDEESCAHIEKKIKKTQDDDDVKIKPGHVLITINHQGVFCVSCQLKLTDSCLDLYKIADPYLIDQSAEYNLFLDKKKLERNDYIAKYVKSDQKGFIVRIVISKNKSTGSVKKEKKIKKEKKNTTLSQKQIQLACAKLLAGCPYK